ncbi:2-phosphosulfolactate phosphatase [Salirhabdus sp. Marseille-P4669]|uniref:2-phosphosulfolactate phosphatase n=1 Tax=Salirhabdus sp. Marseille-P4669 TaxID=2042310 RepID=UPI000C7B3822|nr:2-phosphosulfolactate phosphatase [Salirhabdus sp. Marseille-P4669]
MRKINVILKKEDLNPNKLTGKHAIVFDVLMATSFITFLLAEGATEVYPVLNEREALRKAKEYPRRDYRLVGESQGLPIKDFLIPSPTLVRPLVWDKPFILSTTNGTVALRKCHKAKRIYASSLLNNKAVAHSIISSKEDIIIVCAGSSGRFNLEDYIGAGHLIHHFMNLDAFELTDSARGAMYLYESKRKDILPLLKETSVGKSLIQHGLIKDVEYVAATDQENVVPILQPNGSIVSACHSPNFVE